MKKSMYSPPHPGEFIKETYLDPFKVSQNEIADKLDVARSTFSRLVRGDSNISPEMAVRLSKVLGRSPESWLSMQAAYDLFSVKKMTNWKGLNRFHFQYNV
jgi:addiction module HigA family antidote